MTTAPWSLFGGGLHSQICDDIHKDHIFSFRTGAPNGADGKPSLGISRPQDTGPADLKLFYAAFLTASPRDTMRKYLDGEHALARACHLYLDPDDIKEICKIEDTAQRAEKLLPYLLYKETYNPRENDDTVPNSETQPTFTDINNMRDNDARQQLILCGKGAGEKLVPIFLDPDYEEMRIEIMGMWRELDYKDATPLLVALLEKEDAWWSRQKVAGKEWWLPNPPDNGRARSWSQVRIEYAVKTLVSLRDPRAKEALLLTKKRWQNMTEIDPPNGLAFLCDKALKEIESAH